MLKTRQSSLLLSWHNDMFIILTWKIDFVKCKSLWSCLFYRINVQLDTLKYLHIDLSFSNTEATYHKVMHQWKTPGL